MPRIRLGPLRATFSRALRPSLACESRNRALIRSAHPSSAFGVVSTRSGSLILAFVIAVPQKLLRLLLRELRFASSFLCGLTLPPMMLASFDGHYLSRRALFLVHVTCRCIFLPHANGSPAEYYECVCRPRPFTPEDPRNLAIPFCRNGSTGVEFGTVENLLILDSHFRGCIQVYGCHPGNHPSGPDIQSGCSPAFHGLRIRSHVSLWSVKDVDAPRPAPHPSGRLRRSSPRIHALRLPVYTSFVSFFMSVLGDSIL